MLILTTDIQQLTREEACPTYVCVRHRSHANMTDELICTSSHLCLTEWSEAFTVWGTTQCQLGKNTAVVAESIVVAVCGPCK